MKKLGLPLLLVLIAVSAIGPLTLNGVLPATSAIMQELSTRYETAQLVLTVFLLANLLSQLVLGPAADRFGRRPVMLMSLCVFVIGSIVCAVAGSIEWLLVGRFVQGAGGAVCAFLPRAVVRDIYPQNKAASVIGYMTTAMMVAPLFGPATGGWITDQFTWRYMYAGLAVLGLILVILVLRYQYETLVTARSDDARSDTGSAAEKQNLFSASRILLGERRFLACAMMQSGAVGVYYSFLSGAPFVAMESRGMSASTYGIWFAMVAIGYLSGNLIAGKFSVKAGVMMMVRWGAVPFVLGVLLFWLMLPWKHPVALFFPMLLVAMSNGMALPSMFSMSMSIRPELSASASALAGSIQMACGVLITLAIGYLLPFHDNWLFVIATLSMLVSLTGQLWNERPDKRFAVVS